MKKREYVELSRMPSPSEEFDGVERSSWSSRLGRRSKQAFRPLIPGLMLDLVDFITFGPLGLYLGIVVGCPVGYYICAKARLPFLKRLVGAGLAGIYCTLPFTGWLPAAALLGLYTRFWREPTKSDKPPLKK